VTGFVSPLATRYPRLDELLPEDVARIWMRLTPERQAAVVARAEADGVTVEAYIRQRIGHVLAILLGPPQSHAN
jgi:hypothetical protein